MSKYYNPKRTRNIYEPGSTKPFRLSRSKIDSFLNCPRCFYIDRRLGTGQPPGFPFTLNSAVDTLLKKELDSYRRKGEAHPLMKEFGVDAIPLKHRMLHIWRDALRGGIEYLHPKTNLRITGGIDDVWVTPEGEYMIVDYKATSKKEEVTIDADWQIAYKRQMEIYQWLFRQNGFAVNRTGYFLYCNADTQKAKFNSRLDFDIKIIPYEGDDSWVEKVILDAHACLNSDVLPPAGGDCDFCRYRRAAGELEREK